MKHILKVVNRGILPFNKIKTFLEQGWPDNLKIEHFERKRVNNIGHILSTTQNKITEEALHKRKIKSFLT